MSLNGREEHLYFYSNFHFFSNKFDKPVNSTNRAYLGMFVSPVCECSDGRNSFFDKRTSFHSHELRFMIQDAKYLVQKKKKNTFGVEKIPLVKWAQNAKNIT